MADLQNIKESFLSYFQGIKAEWGKITWPDKKQVQVETFIVVLIVIVSTALIFLLDVVYKWAFSLITK